MSLTCIAPGTEVVHLLVNIHFDHLTLSNCALDWCKCDGAGQCQLNVNEVDQLKRVVKSCEISLNQFDMSQQNINKPTLLHHRI